MIHDMVVLGIATNSCMVLGGIQYIIAYFTNLIYTKYDRLYQSKITYISLHLIIVDALFFSFFSFFSFFRGSLDVHHQPTTRQRMNVMNSDRVGSPSEREIKMSTMDPFDYSEDRCPSVVSQREWMECGEM